MGDADEQAQRDDAEAAARVEDSSDGQPGLLAELLDAQASDAASTDAARSAGAGFGARLGQLVAWLPGRGPTVEFPGNAGGPALARSVIPLDPATVQAAISGGRGVLLQFEDGRPDAPIITGLLQPLAAVQAQTQAQAEGEVELARAEGDALEARVDGRRVEIEAADELVLRCGKASIVLRRNGRVVIRGTYVETRSRGVNRIKGGSVEIN